MNKSGLLKALVRERTKKPDVKTLTQSELELQKEAFFAKGGRIRHYDTLIRTVADVKKGFHNRAIA